MFFGEIAVALWLETSLMILYTKKLINYPLSTKWPNRRQYHEYKRYRSEINCIRKHTLPWSENCSILFARQLMFSNIDQDHNTWFIALCYVCYIYNNQETLTIDTVQRNLLASPLFHL